MHGGCPVLVGSKWITNKWIHSHDQFLKYPCSLNPTNSKLEVHSLHEKLRKWNRIL